MRGDLLQRAAAVALALACGLGAVPAGGQGKFVTIGTGAITGVYYRAGGAICRQVNKTRSLHGMRCSVESTDGSVFNVNAVRDGQLDLALVQSDWQHHAYHGSAIFAARGAFADMRTLFSLHPEPLTVLARDDAGITELAELRGKRVNIGNVGSGQRSTTEVVLAALGWRASDFVAVLELSAAEQAQALCDGRLDALAYTVGHPNGSIREATATCDARLVPVTGPAIDRLIRDYVYYSEAVIPGGLYRGNEGDVASFGVIATVVTSTRLPDDSAYAVVKAVFDDLEAFRQLHPALQWLQPAHMTADGLAAPLHDGAMRYYVERGWK